MGMRLQVERSENPVVHICPEFRSSDFVRRYANSRRDLPQRRQPTPRSATVSSTPNTSSPKPSRTCGTPNAIYATRVRSDVDRHAATSKPRDIVEHHDGIQATRNMLDDWNNLDGHAMQESTYRNRHRVAPSGLAEPRGEQRAISDGM